MGKSKGQLSKEGAEQLGEILRNMSERQQREWQKATEFKPGELTPEEEKLVKREGLNALTYIPQRTLENQAEMLRKAPKEPSGVDLGRQITDRFDGYGYGMFLFLILFFSWGIASSHGWPMGIFCCLLMLTILELSYQLSKRR